MVLNNVCHVVLMTLSLNFLKCGSEATSPWLMPVAAALDRREDLTYEARPNQSTFDLEAVFKNKQKTPALFRVIIKIQKEQL